MSYVICSTEQNAAAANSMETKALLHLLCFDDSSEDIDAFAIDFFNDVTGLNHMMTRLYDVQSKASKSTPALLGKELVTLFKNHVSEFGGFFVKKILFVGSISPTVLDEELEQFSFADVTEAAQKKIRENLINECRKRSYIANESITNENIDSFLSSVLFVIAKPSEEEYIKSLIHVSPTIVPANRKLQGIFNEIRKMQTGIKSSSNLEGTCIESPMQAQSYGRCIKRSAIETLVVSRLINGNPFERDIPTSFRPFLETIPPENDSEVIEDCRLAISRQLFDKNNAIAFWRLVDEAVASLRNNPEQSVEEVFSKIKLTTLEDCTHLDPLAAKYFIAIVKDGLE